MTGTTMEQNAIAVLRQRTGPQHEALENALHSGAIMQGTLTPEQLIDLLLVNQQFLEAVERNAARFPELTEFIVPRAAMAIEDLTERGLSPLPTLTEMDSWDADRVLGALYVGLGSLLGSNVISAKLRELPWLNGKPVRFYTPDKASMLVWKAFLGRLSAVQDPAAIGRIADGAEATFGYAIRAQEANAQQRA